MSDIQVVAGHEEEFKAQQDAAKKARAELRGETYTPPPAGVVYPKRTTQEVIEKVSSGAAKTISEGKGIIAYEKAGYDVSRDPTGELVATKEIVKEKTKGYTGIIPPKITTMPKDQYFVGQRTMTLGEMQEIERIKKEPDIFKSMALGYEKKVAEPIIKSLGIGMPDVLTEKGQVKLEEAKKIYREVGSLTPKELKRLAPEERKALKKEYRETKRYIEEHDIGLGEQWLKGFGRGIIRLPTAPLSLLSAVLHPKESVKGAQEAITTFPTLTSQKQAAVLGEITGGIYGAETAAYLSSKAYQKIKTKFRPDVPEELIAITREGEPVVYQPEVKSVAVGQGKSTQKIIDELTARGYEPELFVGKGGQGSVIKWREKPRVDVVLKDEITHALKVGDKIDDTAAMKIIKHGDYEYHVSKVPTGAKVTNIKEVNPILRGELEYLGKIKGADVFVRREAGIPVEFGGTGGKVTVYKSKTGKPTRNIIQDLVDSYNKGVGDDIAKSSANQARIISKATQDMTKIQPSATAVSLGLGGLQIGKPKYYYAGLAGLKPRVTKDKVSVSKLSIGKPAEYTRSDWGLPAEKIRTTVPVAVENPMIGMQRIAQSVSSGTKVISQEPLAHFSKVGTIYAPEELYTEPKAKRVLTISRERVEMTPMQEWLSKEGLLPGRRRKEERDKRFVRWTPINIPYKGQESEMNKGMAQMQRRVSDHAKKFQQEFEKEVAIERRVISVPTQAQAVTPRVVQMQTLALESQKTTGQKMRTIPAFRFDFERPFETTTGRGIGFPGFKKRRFKGEKRRAAARKAAGGWGFGRLKGMAFKPMDWGLPPGIATRKRWVSKVPKKRKSAKRRKKKR